MEPRKRSQRTEQWRRREAGAASPWLTASHGRAQRRKNLSLALPSATSPLSSPSFPHIYFFFLFLVSFLIGARKRERAGSLGKRVSSACKRSKAAKAAGCSDAETREKREGASTFEYRSRAPGSPAVGLGTSAWRDRGIIFSSCLLLFWGYVKNILHLVVYYHALAYQRLKK